MEALVILFIALGYTLLIFATGYFACLLVANFVQRPEANGSRTVWVCLAFAALPLLFIVDWWRGMLESPRSYEEADALVALAPLFVLLTLGLGTWLARRVVTRTWWQAGLMAVAGLSGHLIVGWPHAYLPVYPKTSPQAAMWGTAGYHLRAARKARPVLRDYGIRLPAGYM